jgi:hypothetical protein
MSTICSSLSSQLITSNLSSMPIIFYQLFTWFAACDIDLHFLLILVRKSNAAEEETK